MTYHELFSFTRDSGTILRDKALIALQLELVSSTRVVDHSGVRFTTFPRILLVLPQTQKVRDSSDFLTDKVVNRVFLVITGISLYLLDVAIVATASFGGQTVVVANFGEQFSELFEIACLGVPVLDLSSGHIELLDHGVDGGATLTDLLVLDQLLPAELLAVFVAQLKRLDQRNPCGPVHVERH